MSGGKVDGGNEGGRPGRRRHGAFWPAVILAVLALAATIAVLGLTGRVISAPGWAVTQVETRANAVLKGVGTVRLGGVDVVVDRNFVPHVRLSGAALYSPRGNRIAILPDIRTTLHGGALLRGRIEPQSLTIRGAKVEVLRLPDGSFDLAMAAGDSQPSEGSLDPVGVVQALDSAFSTPVMSGIDAITVVDLTVQLDDRRSNQVWTATNGLATFRQSGSDITIETRFAVAGESRRPASVDLRFTTDKTTPEASLSVNLSDVSTRDLSAQSPALAWLAALDAPISGALQSGISADGVLSGLEAQLDIGAGALQPTPDTKPVAFDRVSLGLEFDPAEALLTFSDLFVEGPALKLRGGAKAWLKDMANGLPKALVGQIAIRDLKVDPEGLFADPVTFAQGALDFRLRLDPFGLDLGQLVLSENGRRISARGTVNAAPEGWAVSVDSDIDAIRSRRLLALWPLSAVPKTRNWLKENLATSEIFDVRSAFRLTPGQEPHFTLGYEFRDTEVRVIRTLPPIQDGAGYATINDYTYTLVVDRGHVTAPEGGDIDVAGTVLSIPDLRIIPAPAEVRLRTKSGIPAALSLLDQPPFQFMTKAGRGTDIAEGRAEVEAELRIVLADKLKTEDVDYDVRARLIDLRSEKIAPGRLLAAGALDLSANRERLTISGAATLSGVPLDFTWTQPLGPDTGGASHVDGRIELSPRFLDAFAIGLPDGAVRGQGSGTVSLDLKRGAPVEFRLDSDLSGLALSVPEIGWTKPAGSKGNLSVSGRLSAPVEIDRLALAAGPLEVEGKVTLRQDGTLDRVSFARARMGDWFSGALDLVGQGKGRPVAVAITGGTADMQRATLGGGAGKDGGRISVALDRLQVARSIAVTGFRGDFSSSGGFNGTFTGMVNGAAAITGTVAPFKGQSGYRIRASDAGAAMRAAGIFSRGNGGALDLTLRPTGGKGEYNGQATIEQLRVTDAPALAELLDAISVVGLLTQLDGPGILFTSVSGRFRLTPGAVEIREGAAVGPSMGISAAGVYDIVRNRIDLQGTISPIYMLNGVGQIVSKKGEGLFGFNYRLRGPADSPSVSVNPLSILTPGFLREIFRGNAPRIAE